MVAQDAEAGGSQLQDQPELHSETLSQRDSLKKKKTTGRKYAKVLRTVISGK
jgi:hypothetical protein